MGLRGPWPRIFSGDSTRRCSGVIRRPMPTQRQRSRRRPNRRPRLQSRFRYGCGSWAPCCWLPSCGCCARADMENLDVMVLRTLRDWRAAGKRALLATVVRTWGSSPRPIGSIMALCEDGAVVGSVSGGCIEDDLIYRYTGAARVIPTGAPVFTKYGVTADEAHRFGLPCGGTLELLLEFDPELSTLDQLVRALEQGRLMRRTVRLADGVATLAEATSPSAL